NDAVAPEVARHLDATGLAKRSRLVRKTTASTLETFSVLIELALAQGADWFVLTTVDAITAPGELQRFAEAARFAGAPLVLGVAPIEPEDDGPLKVALDASGRATLGTPRGTFATAGYYAGRTRDVVPRVREALARKVPSLRQFLTDEASASVVKGIVLA